MAKTVILEKQQVIEEVSNNFKNAKSVTIVEYRGVSVKKLEALRKELRKEDASIKIYKNTMVERAAKNLGHELDQELVGPNAFVFSNKDAVSAPKILTKFAVGEKNLVVKGGIVEGKVVDAKTIREVAKLPSREGLYAMFLSCIQAPIRQFACTIKAVADSKQ